MTKVQSFRPLPFQMLGFCALVSHPLRVLDDTVSVDSAATMSINDAVVLADSPVEDFAQTVECAQAYILLAVVVHYGK